MKDARKELRIRIPESVQPAFNRAKLKAEQELGMVMTDNEYGRRVLVLALREGDQRQDLPENCRERLRLEGKAYPKSGCAACGSGGITGCPHKID